MLGRFVLPPAVRAGGADQEPGAVPAASLLVVIVASLATAAVGLSPIVGALIAGMLIAETEYHGEVEAMTAPFRGLGLGVFLITVGMSLDLQLSSPNWPSLLLALVGVLVVKALVTGAAAAAAAGAPGGRGRDRAC